MRDSAALWSVGYVTAAEIVEVACEMLIAGYDGPALCMLAAVSPRHADEDVPELLYAALRDVGLTQLREGQPSRTGGAVRVLATRVVAGAMSPMDLAVWAHPQARTRNARNR
jgi:hypothetical protein